MSPGAIASAESIESNCRQVGEHVESIPDWAHLAADAVMPVYWDFHYRDAGASGQVEHFYVGAETVQQLHIEQSVGPSTREALEAALGVSETGASQPDEKIKGLAHELSQGWLAESAGPGGRPGAYGYTGSVKRRREEAGQLVNRHGQVGVTLEAIFSGGGLYPHTDGVALAAVRLRYEANTLDSGGCVRHEACGGVGAAVVNDDHLPRVGLLGQVGGDFREGVTDPGLFVEGRDHDGEKRTAFREGYSSAPST